jgi:hypothetical protein
VKVGSILCLRTLRFFPRLVDKHPEFSRFFDLQQIADMQREQCGTRDPSQKEKVWGLSDS